MSEVGISLTSYNIRLRLFTIHLDGLLSDYSLWELEPYTLANDTQVRQSQLLHNIHSVQLVYGTFIDPSTIIHREINSTTIL